MFIYKITNKINGKVYVGQTIRSLKRRWSEHICSTSCRYLSNAFQKYGKENFQIEVLEECTSLEELNKREEELIKSLNSLAPNGYNIEPGGKNRPLTEETKSLLSKAFKGRKLSPEHRAKISEANKGRKHSRKTRRKISLARKKRVGFKHSENTKLRMSESSKGSKNPMFERVFTEEHRMRISQAATGRKYSEESKQKRRKAIKGTHTQTGEVIFFACAKDAETQGFDSTSICKACKGKLKTHKKFVWEYA